MNICKIAWDALKRIPQFAMGVVFGGAAVYAGSLATAAAPEISLSCPKAVLSCPKCPGYVVQPTIKETCR